MDAIRGFFEERGFIEVETPTLVPSPGLDVHLSAFEVRDPAGKTVGFLATSPEYQMKRLICDGAKRIFQLGRSYRADEQGAHHEREFTILEWYRADAGSDDVIRDTEELVYTLAGVLASPVAERVKPPWPRVSVQDAFERHVGEMVDPGNEELFFRTWAEQVQPRLGIAQAEVVTHWPASMASLARLRGDGTADRFEAFVSGVELCNGFGELTDSAEQRRRFERDQEQRRDAGVPVYPIDERFLEALQRGMPPSGGNALGVDRLLMLLTEAPSIQAVMPFPAERL
jgi:lysyl-tRNA synthetase class 2